MNAASQTTAASPTDTPLVQARNLSIRYGRKTAVDDVSFAIPKGRVVGLLGHNGAGKTTLMKAMVGLAKAEGTLQVLGLNPQAQRVQLLQDARTWPSCRAGPVWVNSSRSWPGCTRASHPSVRATCSSAPAWVCRTR